MINGASRYLSRSRENFSNIVLSISCGDGISILTGTDKRRSRAYRSPRARNPANSQKRAKSIGNEERDETEDEVAEGGRAANSGQQKRKKKTERERERKRKERRREEPHIRGSQKNVERGRGFRTRLCFQAGSSRSRLSFTLIARAGFA